MKPKNDDKEVKKYLLMSKKIKSHVVSTLSSSGPKTHNETKTNNLKKNHLYCNSMM